MKKLIGLVIALGLVAGVISIAVAANPDTGYIVVKCTVTISIDVGDNGTADYYVWLGTHAPNTTLFTPAIPVRNNSSGALCSWAVSTGTIQKYNKDEYDGTGSWVADDTAFAWQWADAAATLKVHARLLFASAFTDEFTATDRIGDGNPQGKPYKPSDGGAFQPTTNAYATAVPGSSDNIVAAGDMRNAYLKIYLPTSVGDQRPRRLPVIMRAFLGDSGL